jgi:two-component system OmpR family response regulator
MMPSKNVLVIEDHTDIANLIQLHLADLACRVELAADGRDGLRKAEQQSFDLIILDLMLPGMDGLEICRRIRRHAHYTPILMLTSKTSELDRVLGLEVGADDYVSKPFSIRELMARVKAQFRRGEALQGGTEETVTRHQVGELMIDVEKRRVTLADKQIDLTAKEFDLLLQFVNHPGRVYSRMQLLDTVWGYGHEGYEHTVNSHINRLRGKIEKDPAHPKYILTVWGVGYKFNDELSA